ncbi:fimbria/pilus outer membrane usher protein [Stenotrophomonas sp. NY11291]|uniref:fimbria/pilus outer membrane usher protein n=1 Tax=Stenotrophomonas sp. NY11291 TaxID=2939415 RepID=UPI0020100A9E|nr:fimbria/pilus outer membrane usher protein [Stenotrophomonas sp. NY11291]UQA24442.1 fimbria/pilus outer membrane usher protein [Stenotrophomonas sp. NY11291]
MAWRALALAPLLWCSSSYGAESIYAISINGKTVDEALLATTTDDGDLLVPSAKLKSYGLVGDFASIQSMKALGVGVEVQDEKQLVTLTVPGKYFRPQVVGSADALVEADPAPKGILINQDLAVIRSYRGDWAASWGYDMRTGLAGGVLINTGQLNVQPGGSSNARGLTTWTKDFIRKGLSVEIGDVFTPTLGITSTSNLLGFNVGTERELTGDLYPVPVIAGIADSRTTAEIYLNNERQRQLNLDRGPYSIEQGSMLNGLNSSSVVLRDQFGREQIIQSDFYFTNRALRPRASEWAVTGGLSRFGSIGNDYRDLALAGFYRRGLSPFFTLGSSAQMMGQNANLGLDATVVLGTAGVLTLSSLASQSDGQSALSYSAGYSFQTRNWSVNAQTQKRSTDSWQLSDQWRAGSVITNSNLASIAYTHRPFQVGLSWSSNTYSTGAQTERLSLTGRYSGANSTLSVQLYRDRDESGFYVFYTRQFGTRQRASMSLSDDHRNLAFNGRAGRINYGLGTSDTGSYANAGLDTRSGRFQAQSTTRNGDIGVTGRYEGSIWLGEGGALVGRTLNRSFALVEVADTANAKLNANGSNQVTNSSGYALFPLSAYRTSNVGLDVSSLPLDAQINQRTQTTTPPRLFGSKVIFPISYIKPLELRAMFQGKIVRGSGVAVADDLEVPIADDGRIFLPTYNPGRSVTIKTDSVTCSGVLPIDKADKDLVQIQCE